MFALTLGSVCGFIISQANNCLAIKLISNAIGDNMQIQFKRMLSTDSPKAIKADRFGYLNGINYGAPHKLAGVGNMCGHASKGCVKLCLGTESGQAAMRKEGQSNAVIDSRIKKTIYFMKERKAFMQEFALHTAKLYNTAINNGKKPACRPNGSWDQAFEAISLTIDNVLADKLSKLLKRKFNAGAYKNIMQALPEIQFLDYTKNVNRLRRASKQGLPSNYHLTFSLSETNETEAREALQLGFSVAAVFGGELPETYLGHRVIDGDTHDLRFLDPSKCIVGLKPKGNKAKRDNSGFVVRNYQKHNS